jgi:outer membrane biosynthesis protein TonB
MALPQHLKISRWLPWLKGGSLFVVISLGLHWAVLQIPIAEEAAVEEMALEVSPLGEPTETIDVVRLPVPQPEPDPQPTPTPSPVAQPQTIPQTAQARAATAQPRPPQPQPTAPPEPVSRPSPEPELVPEPDLAPEPSPPPPPEPFPEPTPMTLDERLQTFAEYQPNNRAKSLATETNEFMNWYLAQTWEGFDSAPLPAPKELAALVVDYPLNQCLTPPPTDGQLEVIVHPDSTLAREPRVVGSTGYDVLDEKAVEASGQYEFPTNEGLDEPVPTVYWLPVEVTYDAATCTP